MFVKDILSSENNNQLTKHYYLLINYINEITELQFVLQNYKIFLIIPNLNCEPQEIFTK